MSIHIGTSGWSYDHWHGVLFPHDIKPWNRLGYYVQQFHTVELNSSFYRWPTNAAFKSWRQRLPPGFLLSEKPNVNVGGSWAYAPSAGIATRQGTFYHPDGDGVTLSASLGTVTDVGGGEWEWVLDTAAPLLPDQITYVYITATDTSGRKDQAAFRLKIGAPDDGSDNGDPHIHTVDGKRYDFQAVGEFILLRDRDGVEIQARQTPVLTANPITDDYTGLKSCVSLNTAVAARVGSHRVSYQPGREKGRLQFYLDGKPGRLTSQGINLDGNIVSGFDIEGGTALRIDYSNHTVLIASPHFWTSHNLWYINVSVSHAKAEEGIMGIIPKDTWLPLLPSGASVGPMPDSLEERYQVLYKTFANAWRVTDKSSLFVYESGTSTSTFTDKDWPAGEPPCNLKPQFEIPGVTIPVGLPIDQATQICQLVTDTGLNKDCVFDVATTGDKDFAKGYLIAQEIKQCGSAVQLVKTGHETVTAIVSPLNRNQPIPVGTVTFYNNNKKVTSPIKLDNKGRAQWKSAKISHGGTSIRAIFVPTDKTCCHPSSSPVLTLPRHKTHRCCCLNPLHAALIIIFGGLLVALFTCTKKHKHHAE